MKKPLDKKGVSRRQLFGNAAMAASALPLIGSLAQAQQPAPAAAAPARRVTPGGTGPIKVLLVTKFHPFNREPFFQMFDSMGDKITWTHVEQPAAQQFFDPKLAKDYDAFVFYDAFAGRVTRQKPDGTTETIETKPSPELVKGTKAMLQEGKGMVFLHHAIASWVHTWPEYVEVMGAAADWGNPMVIRGKDYPYSGAQAGTVQTISVVDKSHPVTAGVEDFEITDEIYLCPMFEDSVHPLLRTSAKIEETSFPSRLARGWHHPPGSNLAGWVKTAENSPVVYLQNGHDEKAWENPSYRKLVLNAINWASSKEALAWAKANPKKIFA